MKTLNITDVRKDLYNLVKDTQESHEPLLIKGKKNNAVLVSEEDWDAIQETLYLISISGMKKSILDGKKESLDNCSKELKW